MTKIEGNPSEEANWNRRNWLAGKPLTQPFSPESVRLEQAMEREHRLASFSFPAMGCRFELITPESDRAVASQTVLAAAEQVELIEQALSVYRPTSDISRYNSLAKSRPVALTGDVAKVMSLAFEWYDKTNGAFDCTLGPLSRCWGFRNRQPVVPSDQAIAEALQNTGQKRIGWDPLHAILSIPDGMEIDFNGIGKGFAVDRIAEILQSRGMKHWLVHAGQSSVSARGDLETENGGWPVGVSHPLIPGERLASLRLKNESLATSGSARQVVVANGQRFGHVLNPRTGWPASEWTSMTVLTNDPVAADVLSTALMTMSEQEIGSFIRCNPGYRCVGVRSLEPGTATEIVSFGFTDAELMC